jgi:hypothetical protein
MASRSRSGLSRSESPGLAEARRLTRGDKGAPPTDYRPPVRGLPGKPVRCSPASSTSTGANVAGTSEGMKARAGHRSALAIAALELATAGHPLIPLHTPNMRGGCSCGRRCSSPGKHPRGLLGLRSASADPERVEAWWWAQPEANIGLRCDGLAVFDVDGPEGERSLERLQDELGGLPPTRGQITGRGWQRLYSIPRETRIGNSTARLGRPAELDLRAGERGYVVYAPSRHANGSRYRLEPGAPIAELPPPWLERLAQPETAERELSFEAFAGASSTAYGRAAMRAELAELARAEPGGRNNALNKSVFKLAGWVPAGELNWSELRERATQAGLALGLPFDEVERTVFSAMNAGFARPRRRSQ